MTTILDQRHMSGGNLHDNPETIRQFWREYAEEMRSKRGFMFFNRQEATDFEYASTPLQPHVSEGRWCADCPRCGGGIALWRENEQSCCLDCGTIYAKVEWPEQVEVAEKALAEMPVPQMRNWRPENESVKRLDARMKMERLPTRDEQIAERLGIPGEKLREAMMGL